MIVPVCVPNYQSIEGAADVIASAQIARRNLAYDRPPALVMPLLSRFDSRTEYESAREWLDIAADRLAPFYDDWLPKGITARQALEWTKLPYVAYFSFGESLPVLGSDLSDPDSLGYAFKRLTNLIRSDLAEIRDLVSSERRPEPVSSIESARRDFFISYAESDQAWAEWITWQLEEAGYRVLLQAWDIVAGSNWTQSVRNGISRAARTIVVLSQEYLQSVYGTGELQAAWSLDPDGAKGKLIPVRVADCDRPGLLASLVSIDLFARSEEQAKAELLRTIGMARHGRGNPLFEPGLPGGGRAVDHPPWFPGTIPTKRHVPPSDSNLTGSDDELKTRGRERFDYDAFISWSIHDEAVAAGIQKGLHRIGRRVGRLRALRVFRGTTDLDADPHLWGKFTEAMDRSRCLIVVLVAAGGCLPLDEQGGRLLVAAPRAGSADAGGGRGSPAMGRTEPTVRSVRLGCGVASSHRAVCVRNGTVLRRRQPGGAVGYQRSHVPGQGHRPRRAL